MTPAELHCQRACEGPARCPCPCHDVADRVKQLLAERFPGLVHASR